LKIKAFTTLPVKKADLKLHINQALSIATAMIAGRGKDYSLFSTTLTVLCISPANESHFA
jgi:hypothetical protein